MKVLILANNLFPIDTAGAIRIHSFVDELSKFYQITLLTSKDVANYSNENVHIKKIAVPKNLNILSLLIKCTRQIRTLQKCISNNDVIFISVPMYELLFFSFFVILSKKKLVIDLRDSPSFIDYKSILNKYLFKGLSDILAYIFRINSVILLRYSLKFSEMVLVANSGIKNEINTLSNFQYDKKIHLVENGVSASFLSTKMIHKPYAKSTLTFAYVGNFSERDSFEQLYDLLSNTKHKVLLIGDGRNKKNVVTNLTNFIGSNRIIDLGKRSHHDIPSLLIKYADIGFIFRNESTHASIPVSLIEFIALGIPILVNDVGIMAEFVSENKGGVVIKEKVTSHILDEIRNINHSQNKIKVINFRKKYSRKTLARKVVKLFSSIKV